MLIVGGAVYSPLIIEPMLGDINQLTPVLSVPLTVAVKWLDPLPLSEIDDGDSVMATGASVTVALADLVGSAMLVALTITACCVVNDAGAV